MHVRTDDDVYRYRAVWLGPRGKTLPFHARYISYALWFPQAIAYSLILWLVGLWPLSIPVWANGAAVAITMAIMWVVDHDRPVRSWVQVLRSELDAPRPRQPRQSVHVRSHFTVRTSK